MIWFETSLGSRLLLLVIATIGLLGCLSPTVPDQFAETESVPAPGANQITLSIHDSPAMPREYVESIEDMLRTLGLAATRATENPAGEIHIETNREAFDVLFHGGGGLTDGLVERKTLQVGTKIEDRVMINLSGQGRPHSFSNVRSSKPYKLDPDEVGSALERAGTYDSEVLSFVCGALQRAFPQRSMANFIGTHKYGDECFRGIFELTSPFEKHTNANDYKIKAVRSLVAGDLVDRLDTKAEHLAAILPHVALESIGDRVVQLTFSESAEIRKSAFGRLATGPSGSRSKPNGYSGFVAERKNSKQQRPVPDQTLEWLERAAQDEAPEVRRVAASWLYDIIRYNSHGITYGARARILRIQCSDDDEAVKKMMWPRCDPNSLNPPYPEFYGPEPP